MRDCKVYYVNRFFNMSLQLKKKKAQLCLVKSIRKWLNWLYTRSGAVTTNNNVCCRQENAKHFARTYSQTLDCFFLILKRCSCGSTAVRDSKGWHRARYIYPTAPQLFLFFTFPHAVIGATVQTSITYFHGLISLLH